MTDECRPVEVDGEIVRVRGDREMNDADRAALADVIAAAKRKLDDEPREQKLRARHRSHTQRSQLVSRAT